MIRLNSLICIVFLIGLFSNDAAGQIIRYRQRTCNKFLLPDFAYSQDRKTDQKLIVAKADEASLVQGTSLLEKRFHIPVSGIASDRVKLSNIGVHINNAGEAIISGKLIHNGGPDKGLSGSNVSIHVRAYSGIKGAEDISDAVAVWQVSQSNFCRKSHIRTVVITNPLSRQAQLKRVFPKITHVEIELEHEVDR